MTDNFTNDPLRDSDEEFQELRLRLSRLPQHAAPPALMRSLKKEYTRPHWRTVLAAWFTWHKMWKPVGAFALVALIAGAWITKWKMSEEELIDGEPLLAAHARYEAESLMPQGDMAGTNFGAQLASYYGNEN